MKHALPKTSSVLRAVSSVTLKEILRDKLLYNALFCAVFLIAASYLASRLSLGDPGRVTLSFGVSALELTSVLIAVLVGAPMMNREFDRRTIHIALSKPVSHLEFLFGKLGGVICALTLNGLLLGLILTVLCYFTGSQLSETFFWACVYALLQSFVVAAIAIFFSSFSTTTLSVVFTMSLFLVGSSMSQIRFVAYKEENAVLSTLLDGVAWILPNFENFDLGLNVVYQIPVPSASILYVVSYSIVLILLFGVLAGILLKRKDA